ncbi:SIR2 family protein [Pseudomonas coronafaciens]|uniref:SIR2-like domain-containing protein n=2 Tax=Pseudomonas syringae group TaxID=136849 RepID=A0AAE6QD99_9PSED|nr:SIR2 family protein [Pseudomonas coronafaciens]QGT80611.1 hypothetical protein GMO17_05180 [Pseudomonas coronafaciens pv. coronafaciens]
MGIISNDPITGLAFSMHENRGVFTVLIGSGLSRSASIPTGWEITLNLIRKAGLATGVEEQSDWAKWYVDTTGNQPNYSTLLEDLAQTQAERRAIIEGFLEPTAEEFEEGLKIPTPAHRAIAQMVRSGHIRVIVTTNFDRLMENALRDVGIEPTVVSSLDGLLGAEPITHASCYILKIHGDYKDARILNTDGELNAYPPQFNLLLDRIFDEFGLIIAGWSGDWDNALHAALLRAPNRRYPTFWLSRGKLGAKAHDLVTHRKATPISIAEADSFFEALNLRLQTLADSEQRNPASLELMVAMAKKFLSKPEYRIQLDDLLAAEHRRHLEILAPIFADQNMRGSDTAKWRETYESATAPLAHLGAVIGRWGDESHHTFLISTIKEMVAEAAKSPSGLHMVFWKKFKFYPAFLVFTGYGIGLVRAGRLSALQDLLKVTVLVDDRITSTLGEYFNPTCFEASVGRVQWDEVDGTKRQTPLSNHLSERLLPGWAPSFAGISNSQLLFARYEFYLALYFHAERTSVEALRQGLDGGRQNYLIIGRVKYDIDSKRVLEQELESAESKAALVHANLVPSTEFLDVFMQCMGKQNWFD